MRAPLPLGRVVATPGALKLFCEGGRTLRLSGPPCGG